jgi:hypothetical protein
MGAIRNVYKIFGRKPGRKTPRERRRSRCEDNIRMNFWKIEWESVYWSFEAQGRDQWWAFLNTVMNLRVP